MNRTSVLGALIPAIVVSALLMPRPAHAGNGIDDYGYGVISEGMGGADLAVSRDTSALVVNPGGLSQIDNRRFDFLIEPYYYSDVRFRDQYGNDRQVSTPLGAFFGTGYAQRIPGTKVVAGVGLFVQGGVGFDYEKVKTAFGTRDDMSSAFSSLKLSPGFGWQVTPQLSVGLTLGINYAAAREKLFPNTSDASGATPFYGFRLDSASGVSFNGIFGFQYRLSPRWLIGGSYTSKAPFRLKGGRAVFDYTAAGLGYVTYRKASLAGISNAQQAGLGVSFSPDARWLLTAEVDWVDWSGAMKSSTLHVSNPDNPGAPQRLDLVSPLNWRDQYIIAAGAEYKWDDKTTLRGGINYGRNPIPSQTMSPLLAVTSNRAISLGLSHYFGKQWDVSGTVGYEPRVDVTYTNPQLPFGANTFSRWDFLIGQVAVSRRW